MLKLLPANSNDTPDPLLHEIFIPVQGFVWLTDAELILVNHPAFQRLRRVKQLGLAHVVYPGATHTRFEHVLGVLGLTQTIASNIEANFDRRKSGSEKDATSEDADGSIYVTAAPLNAQEKRFTRLAALLHDIGHLPFGHSLEDELHLLNKHDKEHRMRLVLNFNKWDPDQDATTSSKPAAWAFMEGSLGWLIDNHFGLNRSNGNEVGRLESIDEEITPSQLVSSIIFHGPVGTHRLEYEKKLATKDKLKVREAYEKDLFNSPIIGLRFSLCADIVGNTICADLIDYLQRDWHHLGKSKFMEDRLFQYMEIACPAREKHSNGTRMNSLPIEHRRTWADKFVINLRSYPRLRTDAVSVILELLENRYNLAEAVLFHRTKLAGTAVLERALQLANPKITLQLRDLIDNGTSTAYTSWDSCADGEEPWDINLEKKLLQASDDSFLENLIKVSEPFKVPDERKGVVQALARRVRSRSFYKNVLTLSFQEGQTGPIDQMQDQYSNHDAAPLNRELALRQLETDFGLQLGDCAMYCPESRMNSKVAEVQVLIQGGVYKLEDYEKKSDGDLAGGHLTAQLRRFKRLWRVSLYLCEDIQSRLRLTDTDWHAFEDLISDYFRLYALGVSAPGKALHSEKRDFLSRIDREEGVFSQVVAREEVFSPVRRTAGDSVATTRRVARTGNQAGTEFSRRLGTNGEFPNGQRSFWRETT